MSESKAHGMASEIRALKDSEEFDLAGYDGAQVTNLLNASFSAPIQLPAGHMIRITFVIGGGKKVRQKYPETLAKDIAAVRLSSVALSPAGVGSSVHILVLEKYRVC